MSLTLRQAIDKTLSRVRLAPGPSVQTYAEEHLKEIIQHKFDVLFDDMWWPQFLNPGEQFTLDGSGRVVEDITSKIKRFQDIRHVWLGTYPSPIARINSRVQPSLITGYGYAPYTGDKVFVVYPTSTPGTVTVSYRIRPNALEGDSDVIDMDEHLIILGSAYDYLNGLGHNPAAEQKLLTMFNERYDQLKKEIEQGEVPIDPTYGMYVTGWQDAPW
jgi:hypothetical protein